MAQNILLVYNAPSFALFLYFGSFGRRLTFVTTVDTVQTMCINICEYVQARVRIGT